MIPIDIIESYKYSVKKVPANTFLFHEGESANFYYQIITGKVKMLNINESGKEFVQGLFSDGQSFGEPPLFQNSSYPASARTIEESSLYKLRKENFLELLKDHFEIHLKFTAVLSKRLMYKAMIMKELSSHDAEHRILTFIDYLKNENQKNIDELYHVSFTRQQLSSLLGIRVETVIRTIKILEEKGDLKIIDRKVYR